MSCSTIAGVYFKFSHYFILNKTCATAQTLTSLYIYGEGWGEDFIQAV